MAWSTSNRRSRLPASWHRTRQRILRDKPPCAVCGINTATQVDHIIPGDNHSESNLQPICSPCHRTKSSKEGAQAKISKNKRTLRKQEIHPFDRMHNLTDDA